MTTPNGRMLAAQERINAAEEELAQAWEDFAYALRDHPTLPGSEANPLPGSVGRNWGNFLTRARQIRDRSEIRRSMAE
jgi:hypothetical protein